MARSEPIMSMVSKEKIHVLASELRENNCILLPYGPYDISYQITTIVTAPISPFPDDQERTFHLWYHDWLQPGCPETFVTRKENDIVLKDLKPVRVVSLCDNSSIAELIANGFPLSEIQAQCAALSLRGGEDMLLLDVSETPSSSSNKEKGGILRRGLDGEITTCGMELKLMRWDRSVREGVRVPFARLEEFVSKRWDEGRTGKDIYVTVLGEPGNEYAVRAEVWEPEVPCRYRVEDEAGGEREP